MKVAPWLQIDKYHVRSGDWTIAKVWVDGVPGYMVYNARKLVGVYDSAKEAMQRAKQIRSAAAIDGSGSKRPGACKARGSAADGGA
jgi:hypothetical protein